MSSSSSPRRGNLLGLIGVVAVGGYFVYIYFAAILFFGFFLALDVISLYLICKSDVSEEGRRLGKKTHAILGFLGLLAVQIVLWQHSRFVGTVNFMEVERIRTLISPYGVSFIFEAASFFALSGLALCVICFRYPENPPLLLRYFFGATASWGSACLMYGFFARHGVIFVDMSSATYFTSATYLALDIRGAERELLAALGSMYFLMSRLRFQNGEHATVHCFEVPMYVMTRHGDLIVPVFSVTLHLLLQALDQHPIIISVDFGTIRPELQRRIEVGVTRHLPGEQGPVSLDGRISYTGPSGGGSGSWLASKKPAAPKSGGPHAKDGGGVVASTRKTFPLDKDGKPSFDDVRKYLREIGKP